MSMLLQRLQTTEILLGAAKIAARPGQQFADFSGSVGHNATCLAGKRLRRTAREKRHQRLVALLPACLSLA
jgi:hypothetical protein